MGTRRTRTKSRPEGGLRRRGSLALLRRAPEREAPERDAPAEQRPPAGGRPRAEPPAAEPRPAGGARPADDRSDERRWREAGGPDDNALYTCSCGYVWEGAVSASVACPHCGTPQAW